MRARSLLRNVFALLFAAGTTAVQAGAEALPVSGEYLREAALIAARQRAVVEAASRETAMDAARNPGTATAPLSYTRSFGNTEVTFDFCSGSHLLMTSNLDSVTELIVR